MPIFIYYFLWFFNGSVEIIEVKGDNKIKLSKTIKFIGFDAFGYTKIKDIYYGGTLEEFGAINTTVYPFPVLVPFSDTSFSGSTFGMYSPVLHCKDIKDSLYYLLSKLQGLLEEIEQ